MLEESCVAMGNGGRYGTDRRATLVGEVWYQRGRTKSVARLNSYASDALYKTGLWRPGKPGSRFRYGGPGRCSS